MSHLSYSSWPIRPLAEVAQISSGFTLGRDLEGKKCRKVPYLRVANVKDGHLDLKEVKTTEATEVEIEDCLLKYGDVLLTEGGDPDKLGRGTYWEEQVPECAHQNHIFRVRFDLLEFDPAFLAFQFGSPYGKAYFLRHAKQTTGIATINKQVLSAFPLMVPSLDEQRDISGRLKGLLSAVQSAQAGAKIRVEETRSLRRKILSQFLGERDLVPLTEAVTIHDYLREPVSSSERARRIGQIPYYGATGQVGWINDFRQDGTFVLLGEDGVPFFDELRPKAYLVHGKCWVNNHAHVIKGKDGLFDDEFLCHALNWANYQDAVSGSTRLKLPQSTMHKVMLPAVPYEEQKILGPAITKALGEVNILNDALKCQINDLGLLPQKLLAQFFNS
jgi:type I restriction enzyme S subunit